MGDPIGFWLTVFKFLGTVISGVMGVLGVSTETREAVHGGRPRRAKTSSGRYSFP